MKCGRRYDASMKCVLSYSSFAKVCQERVGGVGDKACTVANELSAPLTWR